MAELKYGVCQNCGCTDNNPCYNPSAGYCWWVDDTHTLCSHCAEPTIANDPETVHCVNTDNPEITRICEHCGEEFVLNEFNSMAPYAMCDTCYDNYLIEGD